MFEKGGAKKSKAYFILELNKKHFRILILFSFFLKQSSRPKAWPMEDIGEINYDRYHCLKVMSKRSGLIWMVSF